MSFNPAADIPDLSGKVVLVTGGRWTNAYAVVIVAADLSAVGTSGIGRAAVVALAQHRPLHIYFTGRRQKIASSVVDEIKSLSPGCSISFIHCDLAASRDTVRQAIHENFISDRLDILVANAGIMAVPPGLTAEGFEAQFGTNHFGHAILLHLLRPLMLRTAQLPNGDVRVILVSSFGHTMHPSGGIQFDKLKQPDAGDEWQRYGQSKLANILCAKGMAKHNPQITAVSVHPGLVRTSLIAGTKWSPRIVLFKLLRYSSLYKTPEEGAYNILWAATTDRMNLLNGGYYDPVGKLAGEPAVASGAAKLCGDEALAERLWQWTETELADLKL